VQTVANRSAGEVRKVHLSSEQVEGRIAELEARLADPKVSKNQRRRVYARLAQLRKAEKEPELYLVGKAIIYFSLFPIDPGKELAKLQREREKRVEKKLKHRKEAVEAARLEKVKTKNRVCIVCRKKGHFAAECRET
jgi:hypothetical protein